MEKRECQWCFKELVRKENETNFVFMQRQCCDRVCANKNKKKKPPKQKGCVTRRIA